MTKVFFLFLLIFINAIVFQNTATANNVYSTENDSSIYNTANHLLALTVDELVEIVDVNPELSKEGRKPLLMIHGWSFDGKPASPGSGFWNHFRRYLLDNPDLKDNFKPYYVEYWSNYVTIHEIAEALRDKMEEAGLHEETVVIMAHSMGGLVARSFMNEHTFASGPAKGLKCGQMVDRLITLGTPHHGSPMANGPARNARLNFPQNLFTSILEAYVFKDMKYNEINRSELRWSNFDNLLNYERYTDEKNQWLVNLNLDTQFDNKTICYTASIDGKFHSNPQNYDEEYELGSWIIYNGLDMVNDGIVPLSSASFSGHDVYRTRHFNHYNHADIIRGKTNKNELFDPMKTDLLEVRPLRLIWPNTSNDLFVKHSQMHEIIWEAPKNISKINIYFSTDNGNTYSVLSENIDAQTGRYTWLAPEINSSECLIKITNAYNEHENAVSVTPFTVFNNHIAFTTPSRTRYFFNYTENSIEWMHEGLNSEVTITYIDSTHNLSQVIVENLPSTSGENTFVMPANTSLLPSSNAYLKAEMYNFEADVFDEESYIFFSEIFKMFPSPALEFISPATNPIDYFGIEGEPLVVNESYHIGWKQEGEIAHVELFLCGENKEIISHIATIIDEPWPETIKYIEWVVPDIIGDEFYFMAEAGATDDSVLFSSFSQNSFRINYRTHIVSPENNEKQVWYYPCFTVDAPAGATKFEFELSLNNEEESPPISFESNEPVFCIEENSGNKLQAGSEYKLLAWAWIENHRTYADQIIFTVTEEENAISFSKTEDSNSFYCYPNPAKETTTFSFNILNSEKVKLVIYDLNGRPIHVIEEGLFSDGKHNIEWQVPASLKSGSYLCTLKTNNRLHTTFLLLQ